MTDQIDAYETSGSSPPTKACTKCHEVKPLDQYSKSKTSKDGLQYPCKACQSAYREANREKAREASRLWRAANPERKREENRQYHELHPEQRREDGRNSQHRKRVRDNGGVVDLTVTWLGVMEADDWTCGICGDAIDPFLNFPDPMSATVDHIIDVSIGGSHTWENVQAAHLTCNMRKPKQAKKTATSTTNLTDLGAPCLK